MTDDFIDFWKETASVPCNGCTKCCRNEQVMIKPEDSETLQHYKTETAVDEYGCAVTVLQKQPNGDCVHLIDSKCDIYAHRPLVCRSYDCRVAYLSFTRAMREEQIRRGNDGNFEEGRKRLRTLDARRRRAAIMVRKFREKAML